MRPRRSPRGNPGFTTVELLVTLVVLGIVVSLTIPALRGMFEGNQHRSAVNQMTANLFLARQLAVRNRVPHVVELDPSNERYRIFSDDDEDGTLDSGEQTLGPYDMEGSVNLTNVDWIADSMTFFSNGSASQTGDVRISDTDGRIKTIRVSAITGSADVLP